MVEYMIRQYLQINNFPDWWWWSKKSELKLYQEATGRSFKYAVKRWPAGHGKAWLLGRQH